MKWEGGCESRMGATFQSSIVRQGPSTCIASLCVNVKNGPGSGGVEKPKLAMPTQRHSVEIRFFSTIMMGTLWIRMGFLWKSVRLNVIIFKDFSNAQHAAIHL